jgi:hypothetical protein
MSCEGEILAGNDRLENQKSDKKERLAHIKVQ